MAYTTNNRATIDQEVFKWVKEQKEQGKVVTVNLIRQKAFELGQELDPNFKASLNWYNNWKKRYNYSESPEAAALKHKKRHYTAAFKLHAVQRAAEKESASQAALELDVSRRCLQRWAEELEVISSVAEHSSQAVYRRPGQGRKVMDKGSDQDLVDWVKDKWKQGVRVTMSMIREKAIELSNSPDFKASLGWYTKWQKRHGVDLNECTCHTPSSEGLTNPLKLRMLQDGEVFTYTPGTPRKKRKLSKSKMSYETEALLENDEEFDRQLLTWLVERWEVGEIVSDKMVKDKAIELTNNPEFKANKSWLQAWKRKYNISLENQTYGNEDDEEPDEIIEQSEVYDQQVLVEDTQGTSTSTTKPQPANDKPPTKEEAATALASLATEDHEAAGIEIAEALQKLANAFGIKPQDDNAKPTMENLTGTYSDDNPEFMLGVGDQIAVEEVVSLEEIVSDEPMVVIESTSESVSCAPVVSTSSTPVDNIVIETHTTPIVSTDVINTSLSDQAPSDRLVVSTSPSVGTFVSEEVIISEQGHSGDVEVLVEGEVESGIVISPQEQDIHPQEVISVSTESTVQDDMAPSTVDSLSLGKQVTIDSRSVSGLDNNLSNQEIIDVVESALTGADSEIAVSCSLELKEKVIKRAIELDSVQQAASEFSLPWRIVALWLVEQSQTNYTESEKSN